MVCRPSFAAPFLFYGEGMRLHLSTAFLLAGLASCLGACDKEEGERCTELREAIEAHAAALERTCFDPVGHTDCFVTLVGPSTWVAVSALPDDRNLDATVAAYETSCAVTAPPRNVFSARCVPVSSGQDSDVVDEDVGSGGGAQQRHACQLYLGEEPVDFDALEIPDPEVVECDCANHDECGRAELCMNDCQCLPRCEAACTSAELCGMGTLAELGLGTDIDTCAQVCEVNLSDPELQESVQCLATAACGSHAACISED